MKSSFPPIVDQNTRILILGSLPGEESLRQQKYYANPRNSFWRIIFGIFNQPMPEIYEEKLLFLRSKGIGLWDVIQTAERDGSLDSMIHNETPNDFATLLQQFPNIRMLIFNGRKAENAFGKLVLRKQNLPENLSLEYLPSTSPTNARTFEDKTSVWSVLKALIK